MVFEEIVEKLRDRRLNISEVARGTGLSRETLHKLIKGTQKSIKVDNLKKLFDYFV